MGGLTRPLGLGHPERPRGYLPHHVTPRDGQPSVPHLSERGYADSSPGSSWNYAMELRHAKLFVSDPTGTTLVPGRKVAPPAHSATSLYRRCGVHRLSNGGGF